MERLEKHYIHHILQALLESPDFQGYENLDTSVLQLPPPVHELPCGPDHAVHQHMLKTVDIEETSYEGNDKVIAEWYCQLGISDKASSKELSMETLLVWIGDQLTVERIWGLQRYRYEDLNSFDHMDYILPQFGWFHLVMVFANSLHKQYLGMSASIGSLQQAFDVLQHKGLQKTETKGPFWAHIDEALQHIAEAHLHASWLAVAGVGSLQELMKRMPSELFDFELGSMMSMHPDELSHAWEISLK